MAENNDFAMGYAMGQDSNSNGGDGFGFGGGWGGLIGLLIVASLFGGGWGFGGDNSCPIESCSLALWGVKTSKRNPGRKMLVG